MSFQISSKTPSIEASSPVDDVLASHGEPSREMMLKGTVLQPLLQHPSADLFIRLTASDMQSTQHKGSVLRIVSTAPPYTSSPLCGSCCGAHHCQIYPLRIEKSCQGFGGAPPLVRMILNSPFTVSRRIGPWLLNGKYRVHNTQGPWQQIHI